MSVEAALRRVCELVEATAPESGEGFVWLDPDQGAAPSLEDAHEGPDRLFVVDGVQVADAGEGGCVPARVRVAASLRIRYRARGSRMGRSVVQAEDARRLRDALMFAPSDWSYSTTQLVSLLVGQSSPAALVGATDADDPVHEIVTIPLTLEVDP